MIRLDYNIVPNIFFKKLVKYSTNPIYKFKQSNQHVKFKKTNK